MPARSTHIIFHNKTPFLLTRTGGDLQHGGFTSPFSFVDRIAPGQTVEWETESDGDIPILSSFATGTEGFVNYQIGEGPAGLHIHWNNPFISNFDRGNTYNELVNEGFELFHTGGDGNNTIVTFTLAPSVPHRVPRFLPSISAFHFSNSSWAQHGIKLPVVALPAPLDGVSITDTSQGMCGGMSFSVRDYHESSLIAPSTIVPPSTENDSLFQFLKDRLFASWDVLRTGHNYLVFMRPDYPDTDENFLSSLGVEEGRSFAMAVDEWPKIKGDIDGGVLSPIALIRIKSFSPTDIGHNHQVLVYGYELSGGKVTLHIYDPNFPDNDNVCLSFNRDRTDIPIPVSYTVGGVPDGGPPINCFFRATYEQRGPVDGLPIDTPVHYSFSMRDFFRDSGFNPNKGIRSFSLAAPMISVKSIVGL